MVTNEWVAGQVPLRECPSYLTQEGRASTRQARASKMKIQASRVSASKTVLN